MRKISDLKPGDSVFGWMKPGFALRKERRVDGSLFWEVPSRTDRFDKDDLQQWVGIVFANDPVNKILSVNVARATSMKRATEAPLPAQMNYLVLRRLRYISSYAHESRPQNPLWPTQRAIGTAFQAYRTQEEVDCGS